MIITNRQYPLNRTSVELKFAFVGAIGEKTMALNRTSVELKLEKKTITLFF